MQCRGHLKLTVLSARVPLFTPINSNVHWLNVFKSNLKSTENLFMQTSIALILMVR